MGKWSEAQKRYSRSERGRLARKKYQSSPKAREAHKRYMLKRKEKLAQAKLKEEVKPVEKEEKTVKIKKSPESKIS